MTLKYNIFGWLTVPALMLTGACSDNDNINGHDPSLDSEKRIVTLTVNPQGQTVTRADDGFSHISDGSKADMLVYAAYKKNADGKLEIVIDKQSQSTNGVNYIRNTQFPLVLQFIMDPTEEYTVAFWAQSEACKAYDTSNLEKVKVDYTNAFNNYELGDAFCNTAVVKGNITTTQEVLLTRPFAQVNVGDAGWDYEAAAILKPNPRIYAQSTISIKAENGIAQYYNVLEGRTLTQEELEEGESAYIKQVNFSSANIPAFINLSEEQWKNLSYLPYSNDEEFGPKDDNDELIYDKEIEEFLRIKMDNDDSYKSYFGYDIEKSVPDNYEAGVTSTETFKYLSMCYILVPVTKETNDKGEVAVKGAILDEVSFSMADAEGKNSRVLFSISNVPVQQNWRTNIVTDKMFIADEQFKLFIVPTYAGDYVNDSGNNSGDSLNDWNDVIIQGKPNDEGVIIYEVTSNAESNKNDEFPGYNDENGEYDEWDKDHDPSLSDKEKDNPTQNN